MSRRIILGLGNPGGRYAGTRHNVGFRVVEKLADRRGIALDYEECNSRVGRDGDLELVTPQTYMNRSGYAARCLRERRELVAEDFLVVFDEVRLPLGSLRLRPRGSPAGHRGLESILENLGTDRVPRLRLGVAGQAGPPSGDRLVEFVLEPFEDDELDAVEAMIERAADACELWVREGSEAVMQAFNRRVPNADATAETDQESSD